MKKIFSALIGLVILTSTAFSQKIPVEGWLGPGKAKESIECSESWKDSGKRTHYFVCKAPGEITLYGEGLGFKAKQEADLKHVKKLNELIHAFEHIYIGEDHQH